MRQNSSGIGRGLLARRAAAALQSSQNSPCSSMRFPWRGRGAFGSRIPRPPNCDFSTAGGSAKGSPNLPLAQSLLDQVARGKGDGSEPLRYAARLARLWTALRELRKAGEAAAYGSDLAPLWDRALGLWGGAASWFGLHGHLQLSPLAAINTQLDIRSRAERSGDGDGRPPAGARASALYSLALRAGSRRVVHLKQTIALTTEAMATGQETEMGLLDIRGAAHMRLRHFFQAEADFREALAWRERQGANHFSTGDALVHLAFARAFTRPLIGDLHMLDEGLRLHAGEARRSK